MSCVPKYCFFFLCLALICGYHVSEANFDLYIDAKEANLVYGSSQQLFYVRNGIISHQLIEQQSQIIPYNVSALHFHWRLTNASSSIRVAYNIHIVHMSSLAMAKPNMNITTSGYVPNEDRVFGIFLKCSGLANGKVDFLIKMKFALKHQNEASEVNFKRRKVCLANQTISLDTTSQQPPIWKVSSSLSSSTPQPTTTTIVSKKKPNDKVTTKNQQNVSSSQDTKKKTGTFGKRWNFHKPSSTTVIALGAAAGTVMLLALLLTVMYLTRKKRLPSNHSSLYSGLNLLNNPRRFVANRQRPIRNGVGQGGFMRGGGRSYIDEIRRGGNYATISSVSYVDPIINHRMKALTIQGHPASSRWINHYGSNQSSIWSSQTMTSTVTRPTSTSGRQPSTSSMQSTTMFNGNGKTANNSAEDYSSPNNEPINSITTSQSSALPQCAPPQKNALVLENGMLKLCPQTNVSDPHIFSSNSLKNDSTYSDEIKFNSSDRESRSKNYYENKKVNRNNDSKYEMSSTYEKKKKNENKNNSSSAAPIYERRFNLNPPSEYGNYRDVAIFNQHPPRQEISTAYNYRDVNGRHRQFSEEARSPSLDFPIDDETLINEPFSLYSPQIYPHLMPQNFARAQKRFPRSTSGGSVLV